MPARYPSRKSRIALDPGIFAACFPMPSGKNKFLQGVTTEDAKGEIWLSQFDVLAKIMEIAGLLERLSAAKRQAFNSLAGRNPLGDFFHALVTITIEWVGG